MNHPDSLITVTDIDGGKRMFSNRSRALEMLESFTWWARHGLSLENKTLDNVTTKAYYAHLAGELAKALGLVQAPAAVFSMTDLDGKTATFKTREEVADALEECLVGLEMAESERDFAYFDDAIGKLEDLLGSGAPAAAVDQRPPTKAADPHRFRRAVAEQAPPKLPR